MEYFKQLTSEQLITRIIKGYPKLEWQKTPDLNEVLECRIYARAAALATEQWTDEKWEQKKNSKTQIYLRKNQA